MGVPGRRTSMNYVTVRTEDQRRAALFSKFLHVSGYGWRIDACEDTQQRHKLRVLAYAEFSANFLDEELRPAL